MKMEDWLLPIPKVIPVNIQMRFWMHVDQKSENECWPWTASLYDNRYGRFSMYGHGWSAHRISYKINVGDPGTMIVCHDCHNTKCVNPGHLYLGTNSDNQLDCFLAGRKHQKGSLNNNSKLDEKDIPAIRELLKSMGYIRIGRIYGVCSQTIRAIATGRTWSHVK